MIGLSKIFVALYDWIPGCTSRHTITMLKKVIYNEEKSRNNVYNDYDNTSNEP